MLVNFMIIGAQKCGTTTIAEQLAGHPEIHFCQIKEPCYFDRTIDWRGSLATYHALYDPQPGQICGEASTTYTFLPEWTGTHQRLHEYNPALKLIYVMRHPVERVISNYTHRLVRDTVQTTPEEAVFRDPVYLNRSRYGVQLRPYLELFGRDQIKLVIFEEYFADQLKHQRDLAAFLDIDAATFHEQAGEERSANKSVGEYYLGPRMEKLKQTPLLKQMRSFVSPSIRTMIRQKTGKKLDEKPTFTPELKALLWDFLVDDVCTVEEILGRRLDIWRQGYSA